MLGRCRSSSSEGLDVSSGDGLRTRLTLSSLSSAPLGYCLWLEARLCPRPDIRDPDSGPSSYGGENREEFGNGDVAFPFPVKVVPYEVAGAVSKGSSPGKFFWLANRVAGADRSGTELSKEESIGGKFRKTC